MTHTLPVEFRPLSLSSESFFFFMPLRRWSITWVRTDRVAFRGIMSAERGHGCQPGGHRPLRKSSACTHQDDWGRQKRNGEEEEGGTRGEWLLSPSQTSDLSPRDPLGDAHIDAQPEVQEGRWYLAWKAGGLKCWDVFQSLGSARHGWKFWNVQTENSENTLVYPPSRTSGSPALSPLQSLQEKGLGESALPWLPIIFKPEFFAVPGETYSPYPRTWGSRSVVATLPPPPAPGLALYVLSFLAEPKPVRTLGQG